MSDDDFDPLDTGIDLNFNIGTGIGWFLGALLILLGCLFVAIVGGYI